MEGCGICFWSYRAGFPWCTGRRWHQDCREKQCKLRGFTRTLDPSSSIASVQLSGVCFVILFHHSTGYPSENVLARLLSNLSILTFRKPLTNMNTPSIAGSAMQHQPDFRDDRQHGCQATSMLSHNSGRHNRLSTSLKFYTWVCVCVCERGRERGRDEQNWDLHFTSMHGGVLLENSVCT